MTTLDGDERQELATKWQLRARVQTIESTLTAQGKLMDELMRDARQTVKRAQAAHERLDELKDNDAVLANMLSRLEALGVGQAELADKVQKLRDWAVKKFENGKGKHVQRETEARDSKPGAVDLASDESPRTAGG